MSSDKSALLLCCLLFAVAFSCAASKPGQNRHHHRDHKAVDDSEEDSSAVQPSTKPPAEVRQCTVRVHKVEKFHGKCIRLHGGHSACQTADYLDPANEQCAEM